MASRRSVWRRERGGKWRSHSGEWAESLTVPLHGSVSPGCVQCSSCEDLRKLTHSLTHPPVPRILYGPAQSPVTRSGAENRPVLRWVKRTMNNVCIKWSQLTQTPVELALKESHAGSATVKVRCQIFSSGTINHIKWTYSADYNPEIIRALPVRLWSCLLDKIKTVSFLIFYVLGV